MLVTQAYARPSAIVEAGDGLLVDLAPEETRAAVFLDATVRSGPAWARAMGALRDVVQSDLGTWERDHADYQAWVNQRYLEELDIERARKLARVPALLERRQTLRQQQAALLTEIRSLDEVAGGTDFERSKRRYWRWLKQHDYEGWIVLDPVVSVHPDAVIFEAFSLDESSYGRVTVPTQMLSLDAPLSYGTTNVDFSAALARELARVRSYRPARLRVGREGVAVATHHGQAVEKKIDLPDSWVRGFLQVQSASTMRTLPVTLSAGTVANVLALLRRRRERQGPRSLKFLLEPGQRPTVVVEPWGDRLTEPEHTYLGPRSEEIRIWGRRRLTVLERLLPYAETVGVRLLGTGMPSYWSIASDGMRFDLGLSGWTRNDWAAAARFDALAATAPVVPSDVVVVIAALRGGARRHTRRDRRSDRPPA